MGPISGRRCLGRNLGISLLLLWGLWLWLGANPAPKLHSFSVALTPSQALIGRLYLPPTQTAPFPALLLCHGVNSSKDTLAPLAQSLARRGIAAVVFDFGGYGQSYPRPNDQVANLQDATAVLVWMQQQPQLDPQHLGIGGHSMGGITALELAKSNPALKTTIVLSIAGPATPTSPANLWLGSGVYEELNPVGDIQALFASAVAGDVRPSETVGDFAEGTARRLFFSTTVDHALAPFDAALTQEIIAWSEQSFGLPVSNLPIKGQSQIMGMVMATGSGIALAIAVYTTLWRWGGRWGVGIWGLAMVVLLWLPGAGGAGWTMAGLIALMVGNYSNLGKDRTDAIRVLLYGVMVYGTLLFAIAVNAVVTGSLLAMPQAIWGLPMLAKTLCFGLLYDRFHLLRYGLDSMGGNLLAVGLVAIEVLKPGCVLNGLGILAARFVGAIRQPISWRWQQVSRRTLLLIPVLLVILGSIVWRQQQAGLLTWEAGIFALRLMSVFCLLPGVMGILIARSHGFQKLENRLIKTLLKTDTVSP